MGKSSRKMNKKINRQQAKTENKELTVLQNKLTQQYEAMDYDGALETIAELMAKSAMNRKSCSKPRKSSFCKGIMNGLPVG